MTAPVLILTVSCEPAHAERLADELLASGVGAVEQRAELGALGLAELVVYAGECSLAELAHATEEWAAVTGAMVGIVQSELSSDWAHAWTEHLRPFLVHEGLRVVPSVGGGSAPVEPGPPNVRDLYLEAGLAFGYGEHPTTQMASEWLASHVSGARVLDFGTGSGILALIALASGARSATGLDNDEDALLLARRNAQLNGLSQETEFSSSPLSSLREDFDVVVANIDAVTLASSASELCRATTPGGLLALTGLLEGQHPPVIQAFANRGVSLKCQETREQWVLLVGRKPR